MPALAQVAIHPSQFPENVRRGLLECLRLRHIAPRFHYESYQQSQKWLALHQAYSPSRADADCAAVYERALLAAAQEADSGEVGLIGLGCGGGQKDARLLSLLAERGRTVSYVPCDVSVALVLTASQAARRAVAGIMCHPLVLNLECIENSGDVFDSLDGCAPVRLLTFFGMIPNFEPAKILPILAAMVRPADLLLFSANLAPGSDYAAGARLVLPGYDNPLTRDWLLTFWRDLGVEADDGALRFSIEDSPVKVKRIVADFIFTRRRTLSVEGEPFEFKKGAKVRLFFSYRYTPPLLTALLLRHRLEVLDQWITASGEEGVFLCRKKRAQNGLDARHFVGAK